MVTFPYSVNYLPSAHKLVSAISGNDKTDHQTQLIVIRTLQTRKKAKSQDSRDEAKHPCEDEMLTALSMSEDVSKTLEQIPASKTGQSRELLREC